MIGDRMAKSFLRIIIMILKTNGRLYIAILLTDVLGGYDCPYKSAIILVYTLMLQSLPFIL